MKRLILVLLAGMALLLAFGQPGGSLRLSDASSGHTLQGVAKPALDGIKSRARRILE